MHIGATNLVCCTSAHARLRTSALAKTTRTSTLHYLWFKVHHPVCQVLHASCSAVDTLNQLVICVMMRTDLLKYNVVCCQCIKSKRELYVVHGRKSASELTESGDQSEGLGRLPRTIHSISSLLLFNTSENP